MEDIIVLRIGKGNYVLSHESFHKYICYLFDKMNNNLIDKYYYEALIEDLIKNYISYEVFKTGCDTKFSDEELVVLRIDKGMSLITHAGFYNKIYDLYEKMFKTTSAQEKVYHQELIEDLVKNFSNYICLMSSSIKQEEVGEEAKEELVVEESQESKIINISDIKKLYKSKVPMVYSAMN